MGNQRTDSAAAKLAVGQESVAFAHDKEVPIPRFPVGQESIAHDHATPPKELNSAKKKK